MQILGEILAFEALNIKGKADLIVGHDWSIYFKWL